MRLRSLTATRRHHDRGEREPQPERVGEHVSGVGEQREGTGGDRHDELHDEERDDDPERDAVSRPR